MNPKAHILLVEDEEHLQEALKLNLELEGYDVTCVVDGNSAVQMSEQAHFDLIIMDVMLPEMDGISATEAIRLQNREVPILILSARNSSEFKIKGLRLGADDYLTKPFHLEELLLRIGKLIEKNNRTLHFVSVPDPFHFGGNSVFFAAQSATNFAGNSFSLSKKEILLLRLLIEHANEVVTREKILQLVWGYQVYPTTRTIDNFILNFRKYFEQDSKAPRFFHSVRGAGYRFTPDSPL
ncbi:MAG: DNA-binding response regulator [Chitinophagia bacterium]|nr:DNA-binding response regulator [Chitinophagia bacterium]